MWSTLGLLVSGLIVLLAGGEILVRSSSRLAVLLGLSPLIIGLTIVSFGTSSPELVVSVRSALAGQPDLALGNVVGSNIVNILGILGVCALISPIPCAANLLRRDMPVMIAASLLAILVAANGNVGRLEGLFLFCCLVLQTVYAVRKERTHNTHLVDSAPGSRSYASRIIYLIVGIVCGLALLTLGADLFTSGATTLARLAGVSELTIALTVVAIGTSLPELITSAVASARGHNDIALGNIVGSNIFNILSVLGLSAMIAPINVSHIALGFDMPVMLLTALLLLGFLCTGRRLSRTEGFILLLGYCLYSSYLLGLGS